jgi:hypothetical protein
VFGAERQGLEDQQIERAGQELGLGNDHGTPLLYALGDYADSPKRSRRERAGGGLRVADWRGLKPRPYYC